MNEIIERIWFEVTNMHGKDWGYDGMEGDGDWVMKDDVIAIIEKYLPQPMPKETDPAQPPEKV